MSNWKSLPPLGACSELDKHSRKVPHAFRLLGQRHRKRGSQHGAKGCCASRSRLHYRRVILQATEWQRVIDQIDTAMIFARTDFVKVHWRFLLSLSRCCVESKRGRIRRVKHWIATLAILVTLFASLVGFAPITYACEVVSSAMPDPLSGSESRFSR